MKREKTDELARIFAGVLAEFQASDDVPEEVSSALADLFKSIDSFIVTAYEEGQADEHISTVAFLSARWPDASKAIQNKDHQKADTEGAVH